MQDDIDDVGTTVTSVMSVSADPPLVAVGLTAGGYPAEVLEEVGRCALTVLGAAARDRGQPVLLGRAAQRPAPARGGALDARPGSGAIVLDDAPAALDCRLERLVPAGDHVLALLVVEDVPVLDPAARPLLRLRGRYVDESGAPRRPAVTASAEKICRPLSHPGPRRCLPGVDLVRPAVAAAVPLPGLRGAARPRTERGVRHADERRDDVRTDLEEVFRSDYARVVAVAARVLGSRDQAEDVAQEVFLSFGRSSVPADEAGGWLTVAAAHTALNLLRSGPPSQPPARRSPADGADRRPRRRRPRGHPRGAQPGPGRPRPGCPTSRRPRWSCGTAA